MNSLLKGFLSLFDWMFPKTIDESMSDLDNSMQDLCDRMGWGIYHHPFNQENPPSFVNESQRSWIDSGWNTTIDINRVLEGQQNLINDIYGYNFRKIVTKEFHKPLVKDPARPRVNKYI